LKTFKSKFCCECSLGVETPKEEGNRELFFSLPCDCLICSEWCLNSYLDTILKDFSNRCVCGNALSCKDFLDIYLFLDRNKLNKQKEVLHHFIKHRFKTTCCFCLNRFDLYSDETIHKIVFEDQEFTKLFHDFDEKKFIHLICDGCYINQKVKEKMVFSCLFCENEHKITKLVKKINLNSDKDDDCLIF
jgi:hypothetical protein